MKLKGYPLSVQSVSQLYVALVLDSTWTFLQLDDESTMADQPPADAPMAGTEEEENPSNTAEDDSSRQATTKTVHQPIPYEGDEIKYTVKFVFRPEDDKSMKSLSIT